MSLQNLPPPINNCKNQLCLLHTRLHYSVSDYIQLQRLTHVQLFDTAQRDMLAIHQLSKGILTQPLWDRRDRGGEEGAMTVIVVLSLETITFTMCLMLGSGSKRKQ